MDRDELIRTHMHLVPITRKRVVPVVPWRVAADTFDHERGIAFRTYASSRIRGAMLEYLRQEDWLPRSIRDWQKRFSRAEEALVCRGEPVTWETLAGHLSVTQDACEALWQLC